jgi:ketosteroid isomerase-like protein
VGREDVERLRSAYAALNDGDIPATLSILDSEAEWAEHSSLPEAGTYYGREAIESFLVSFLDSWEEFRQETEDLVDNGDRVAVILHSFARGRGSGIEVEGRYVHVWTMRDGRGVRVDTYDDVERGLEALRERAEA